MINNQDLLNVLNSNTNFNLFKLFEQSTSEFNNPYDGIEISCEYFESNNLFSEFKNDNNIKLLSWNICSLNAKFNDFKDYVNVLCENEVTFDIIAIQEAWQIKDENLLKLPNYNLIYKTRGKGKRGGGVAFYIKNDLKFKEMKNLSYFHENVFESLCIEVEISIGKKILLANVYRPNTLHNNFTQTSQLDQFIELFSNLQNELDNYKYDSYILSDTNIDMLKFESNMKANELLMNTLANGYLPLISKPTRVSNTSYTCIDQIFTNKIGSKIKSGILVNSISDHFPTFTVIQQACAKKKTTNNYRFIRVNNELSWVNCIEHLNNYDWSPILESNSTEESFNILLDELVNTSDLFFPIKKIRLNRRKHAIEPFMTKGILISRSKKIKLNEKSIKNPTPVNIENYKRFRLIYNKMIKTAKQRYFENALENNKSDPRKTWEILKSAMKRDDKKSFIPDEIQVNGISYNSKEEISSKFNDYFTTVANEITSKINPYDKDPLETVHESNATLTFHPIDRNYVIDIVKKMDPKSSQDFMGMSNYFLKKIINCIATPLTHIINLSLLTGEVPSKMKLAKVIPIFKAGDVTLPNNFRPISLLPILSKIIEKVVANQLLSFLNENELLYKHQYGFQARKSTIHPILQLINEIGRAKNNNLFSIGVFCDITKGFDTVSHEILLKKLRKYGIKDNELKWFQNYLFERKQFVQIQDSKSHTNIITRGVPQGSILGPLLFLIFINDLPNVTDLLTLLFADDTSFLISGNSLTEVIAKLNTELKKVCDWFRANELSLHPDKTKVMIFNKKESTFDMNEININLNFNNAEENDSSLISKINCVNSNSETPAIKFLGVFIDPDLNFKYHINILHQKISKSVFTFKCIKKVLSHKALITLYYAFVHSQLLYCLPAWSSSYQSYLNPLTLLQKKVIRIISGKRYNSHTANLFRNLDILPIHELSIFSKLTIMYDYINNKLPSTFSTLWRRNNEINVRALRNLNDFYIPLVRKTSIENFPEFYFQKLWNEMCNNDLLTSDQPRKKFVKNLKVYLMLQVETICNNNSCLECRN